MIGLDFGEVDMMDGKEAPFKLDTELTAFIVNDKRTMSKLKDQQLSNTQQI